MHLHGLQAVTCVHVHDTLMPYRAMTSCMHSTYSFHLEAFATVASNTMQLVFLKVSESLSLSVSLSLFLCVCVCMYVSYYTSSSLHEGMSIFETDQLQKAHL